MLIISILLSNLVTIYRDKQQRNNEITSFALDHSDFFANKHPITSINHKMKASVLRIIDGDTFEANLHGRVEMVRMLLIDTPETVHPHIRPQPYGKEASKYTYQLLRGKIVELEQDQQKRDLNGRLLMYVYLKGKSVQKALLAKGLARVAVYPPNQKYEMAYKEVESHARKQLLGIWSIQNHELKAGSHP